MGLFSGLRGHASEIDPRALESEFGGILIDGESVDGAYRLVRDLVVVTNRRLLLADRQGLTGRKRNHLSIPYRSILRFSIGTAGSFDSDAERRIWLSGQAEPVKQEFRRGNNIQTVHRVLAEHVLG